VAAPTFATVIVTNITVGAHDVGKMMVIKLANRKLGELERLVALNLWQSTSTNASSMTKGSNIFNRASNNANKALNMRNG